MSTGGKNSDNDGKPDEAPRLAVPAQTHARVAELVENFRNNEAAYKSPAYNETQTRREFIDPFFKALGWDVNNEAGDAPAYKDVIHEDAIKVGGMTKAPDYAFRIGGQRKFFVEAKAPWKNLKEDPEPYFQLRRYAYSAKLPLSILTDFEELAIVDCRAKPSQADKASAGRIRYWHYSQYLDNLEEIYNSFSKEAVRKGFFDRYVASAKAKRGTSEVDKEFLKEIESWRELLARNIALRNPALTQRDLNYAVQATIDRIIFLRICEDRGIEEYGVLQGMQNGTNVYTRLCQLFQRADQRYNSGLFHFKQERGNENEPDTLTLGLAIDDKPLKTILKGLYYPDSPYEFSVLPADILGQVYEQFLGKVIRLTAGHQARIEDKPEVKKSGGVYYTPTYIVDYIVKNTVGKLLGCDPDQICHPKPNACHPEPNACHPERSEGSRSGSKQRPITPKEAAKLRILDPACGSGSFLIGAFEYLMDWHRDWYIADGTEKWAGGKEPRLFEGKNGWQLTTAEKKRILLNNIYGVDIDSQAVEVTKLSLLLKVLEEESAETIGAQLTFMHERALPDLGNNIKCGNSLIGTDFYEGQQLGLLDDEERYRINAFDWETEFPEIFSGKNPGFDAVIGNPPYVRIQTTGRNEISYFNSNFVSATGNYDIYCVFIERGLSLLMNSGRMGLIIPHRFFKADYGEGVRGLISKNQSLLHTIDFDGFMVFESASINTCILVLGKNKKDSFEYCKSTFISRPQQEMANILSQFSSLSGSDFSCGRIDLSSLNNQPWIFISDEERPLWSKLNTVEPRLGDITTHIFQGLKTSADKIFILEIIDEKKTHFLLRCPFDQSEVVIEKAIMRPLIKGGQMNRYHVGSSKRSILFPYEDGRLLSVKRISEEYPQAWRYLETHKTSLENREHGKMKGDRWYAFGRSQALVTMSKGKIITPDYYARASYCFDPKGKFFFCGGGAGGYGIILASDLSYEYVLGLLNSRLVDWFLHKISMRAYQTAYMYVKKYIEQLPINPIDFSNSVDKSRHDQMVDLVNQMLNLNKQLQSAKTAHDKDVLQRQIDATDRQIDRLVYELYDLTDDEIRIVESN